MDVCHTCIYCLHYQVTLAVPINYNVTPPPDKHRFDCCDREPNHILSAKRRAFLVAGARTIMKRHLCTISAHRVPGSSCPPSSPMTEGERSINTGSSRSRVALVCLMRSSSRWWSQQSSGAMWRLPTPAFHRTRRTRLMVIFATNQPTNHRSSANYQWGKLSLDTVSRQQFEKQTAFIRLSASSKLICLLYDWLSVLFVSYKLL